MCIRQLYPNAMMPIYRHDSVAYIGLHMRCVPIKPSVRFRGQWIYTDRI